MTPEEYKKEMAIRKKKSLEGRKKKQLYHKVKKETLGHEEDNFSKLYVVKTQDGWYKMFDNSAFVYAYELAPRFEKQATYSTIRSCCWSYCCCSPNSSCCCWRSSCTRRCCRSFSGRVTIPLLSIAQLIKWVWFLQYWWDYSDFLKIYFASWVSPISFKKPLSTSCFSLLWRLRRLTSGRIFSASEMLIEPNLET